MTADCPNHPAGNCVCAMVFTRDDDAARYRLTEEGEAALAASPPPAPRSSDNGGLWRYLGIAHRHNPEGDRW